MMPARFLRLSASAAFFGFLLGAAPPAGAQSINPTEAFRSVSVAAFTFACEGDGEHHFVQDSGFDPFDEMVEAAESCPAGGAFSGADQRSRIGTDALTAFGSARGRVIGDGTFGLGFADSTYHVTFELGAPSHIRLMGELAASGILNGAGGGRAVGFQSRIALVGPGNESIFVLQVLPGPKGEPVSRRMNASRMLDAGVYQLTAHCVAGIDNLIEHEIVGGASFDFIFELTPGEPGDLNCDGSIDALDIEPFLTALFDPLEYPRRFPNCDINLADIDGDGEVNALDIEPFLGLLFGP